MQSRRKIEASYLMGAMATVHMSEAEVARDLHAVLARVQQGVEIVIKQDDRPVAVIQAQHESGRPIAEILREAKLRNLMVTFDVDFGKHLEEIVASHEKPWNPPSWN